VEASGRSKSDGAVKAAMFLNFLGEDALELFNTFNVSAADQELLLKIKEAFESYLKPQKNVIYKRFIFYNRKQEEQESFEHFLTDLKKIIKSYKFGLQEKDMLRDRIVIGISDSNLQERLLRTTDLDLNKVIKLCQAAEISKSQVRQLRQEVNADQIRMTRDHENMVNRRGSPNKVLNNGSVCAEYLCKRCNRRHGPRNCPAFGKRCTN
jgi:hypothetical protein